MSKTELRVGTDKLRKRVHAKYGGYGWLVIDELRDATGFASRCATDVIAIGMYKSRNFEFHGIEIKTSRSDWLHDLNNPAKNDTVAAQCDFWWIAADKGVVKADELPDGWGLYTPSGSGLRATVRARRRNNPPVFTRPLVASLLQRVQQLETPGQVALKAEYARGYKEGKLRGAQENKWALDAAEKRATSLETAVATFERASGLHINSWNAGDVGAAVAALRNARADNRLVELQHSMTRARDIAATTVEQMNAALAAFAVSMEKEIENG
ncbi:MAG TPA: hypothetical protein VLT59_11290 [Steroidobacteraceae bacterium]|nr:hypothetical protein [Steroidobacteraceae bacterium]